MKTFKPGYFVGREIWIVTCVTKIKNKNTPSIFSGPMEADRCKEFDYSVLPTNRHVA